MKKRSESSNLNISGIFFRYARAGTLEQKLLFSFLYKVFNPIRYLKSKLAVLKLSRWESKIHIDNNVGFSLCNGLNLPGVKEAVTEANNIFNSFEYDESVRIGNEYPFTSIPIDFTGRSSIIRLALSAELMGPIGKYFGHMPILSTAQLVYSPNNLNINMSSQYFHLDGQDVKSMQVFIYCGDVNEDSGPTTILSSEKSYDVCRSFNYRKHGSQKRLDDAQVAAIINLETDLFRAIGGLGSILFFDGDRCLHYGSRKGGSPRRVIHFLYLTPFAFTLCDYDKNNMQMSSDAIGRHQYTN